MTSVSVVVVTYRGGDLLADCLGSVNAALSLLDCPSELVVVDNGSTDGSAELVRSRFPAARALRLDRNLGFSAAANLGIRASSGDWVVLVNDDVTLDRQAVAKLLQAGARPPDIGSVAPQIRFAAAPGVIGSAGIEVDRLGVSYDRLIGRPVVSCGKEQVEVFGASAATACYRRRMLEELGGFDESFFAYLEDVDLAWRARMRGWRCVHVPTAVAYHQLSATAGHGSPVKYFLQGRNRIRLLAKNAVGRQLTTRLPEILLHELAYVAFVALRRRTLSPLRGRLRGLWEWRRYRRAGRRDRRHIPLAETSGLRAALIRNRVATSCARTPR
jgi:GT2 family glycosyltransferase